MAESSEDPTIIFCYRDVDRLTADQKNDAGQMSTRKVVAQFGRGFDMASATTIHTAAF